MADKDEDEYQFSETESTDIYGDAKAEKEAVAKYRQVKKIIFIFAILAILFAVYKLSGLFRHPGKVTTTTSTVATLPEAPPAVQQVPVAAIQTTPQAPTKTAADETLANLEARSASAKTDIDKLTADVETLKNTVASLQTTISTLNDSVQTLSNQSQQQMQQMQQQIDELKVFHSHKKKAVSKAIRVFPHVVYYVEAMIPGRAWLKDKTGATSLTVSVGDRVRGYEGQIVSIDPHNGVVMFSSGKIIGYRPNDR